MKTLSEVFPICRVLLGVKFWKHTVEGHNMNPDSFPEFLEHQGGPGMPSFLSELARIELSRHKAITAEFTPLAIHSFSLNPSLQITPVTWKNLASLCVRAKKRDLDKVVSGNEIIITWCQPDNRAMVSCAAEPGDVLAIKLVAEDIDPLDAAREAGVPVGIIDAVIREAVWKGLVISPPSMLCREQERDESSPGEECVTAEVFSLQWHLTQECDLHCRHCYDRSNRRAFPFERAFTLLDELRAFCRRRYIRGQVSLSGGNPLLYPHFLDLYRAAAERDFMLAILGNASDRATIERIVEIQMPVYYQVSLEGLEQHNDEIRGAGNYRRTVDFLRTLTEMGVPNMVMLTLTRHNRGQVIPLAEELEGITGGLTFNRLALFGEGAGLELPTPDEYREFLEAYVAALDSHPVLTLKDSLLNTIFERDNSGLFGGCAGYGCGAAFNFVSILSDGEVHACRKFPSPIGNILINSLEELYASTSACRYRAGSSACSGCSLNAVCRGCPAVTASLGLDPFTAKDPYCFRHLIA
ncbi:MAG: thio(seleno)oxazole modification radical SAM maturase SbtM [Desulfuromonadaceae bacterium]|nr:thio(seleno)oxazole modification radical SAM maturase SbtM [Desulfuromonadaceae bacterium]